jgi:hypothetical protein
MNFGLNILNSRRMWVVPNFVVWGLSGLGEIDYLNLEEAGGTKSVFFGSIGIGDTAQSVSYSNLIDVRGNNLPVNIKRPVVTARSQSESQVYLVGSETGSGFKIARDAAAHGPVTVDLIITELGE